MSSLLLPHLQVNTTTPTIDTTTTITTTTTTFAMNEVEGVSAMPPALSSSQQQPGGQKQYQFSHSVTSQNATLASGQTRAEEFGHTRKPCKEEQTNSTRTSDVDMTWSGGWRDQGGTFERSYETEIQDNQQGPSPDRVQTVGPRDSQGFTTSHLCNYREQSTTRFSVDSMSRISAQITSSPGPFTKTPSREICNASCLESPMESSAENRSTNHIKEPVSSETPPPPLSSSLYHSTLANEREHMETSWSSASDPERGSTGSRPAGSVSGALDLTLRPTLSPRLWSPEEKSGISALLEVSHACPECSYTAVSMSQLTMHFDRHHAVQGRCVCQCGQGFGWLTDLQKHRKQCVVYRQFTGNHTSTSDRKRCAMALQNGDAPSCNEGILVDQITYLPKQDEQLFCHKAKRLSQCPRTTGVDWSPGMPMKHVSCQNCHRAGFPTIGDYLDHCNQCELGKAKMVAFVQKSVGCSEIESSDPTGKGIFPIPSKQAFSRFAWQESDVEFNDPLRSTNSTISLSAAAFETNRSNRFTGVSIPPPLGLNTLMKSAGYPVQAFNFHHSVGSSCNSELNKMATSHAAPSRVSDLNSSTREIRTEPQGSNSTMLNTSTSAVSIVNGTDLSRPFKCCHCIKAFKSKALLDQHMHIHYPPKYTCRYCAKKYRWPPVFYHHQRACKKRPLTTTCTSTAPTISLTNSRELSAGSHHGNNNNIMSASNPGRHHWSHNVGGLPTANYSNPSVTDLSFTFSPASSICFPPLGAPGSGTNSSENKHLGSPLIAPSLSSSISSTMSVSSPETLPLASYFSLPAFHLGMDPFSTPTTSTVLPPPNFNSMDLLHNSLLNHLPGNPASINWAVLTAAAAATAAMSGLRLPYSPGALPNPLMLGHLPPPPLGFHANNLPVPSATALYNPCLNSLASQSNYEDQSSNTFHGSMPSMSLPDWLPMLGNSSHSPMDLINLPSSLLPSASGNKAGIITTTATSLPPQSLQPSSAISCSNSTASSVSLPQFLANLSNASGTGHLTCVCTQRFNEMPVYMAHISTCPLFHHILLTSATCFSNNNNNSGTVATAGPTKNHKVGDLKVGVTKHNDPAHLNEHSTLLNHEFIRNASLQHADKVNTTAMKAMISDQMVSQASGALSDKLVELNEATSIDNHISTPMSQLAYLWKNNFPLNGPGSMISEDQSVGKDQSNGVKRVKMELVPHGTTAATYHSSPLAKGPEGKESLEILNPLRSDWKRDPCGQIDDVDGKKTNMSPPKHCVTMNNEPQNEVVGQLSEQQVRQAQSLPFWLPPYMKSLLPETGMDISSCIADTVKASSEDTGQPNPTSSLMAAMATVLANAAAAAGFQYPNLTDPLLQQQNSESILAGDEDLVPASSPSASSAIGNGSGTVTTLARLCQLCGKEFSSRLSLKQHVEGKHSAEGKYQCPGCAKRYRWGASYYYHKKSCPAVRYCTPPSSVQDGNDFCPPLGLLSTHDDSVPPTPFPSPTQVPSSGCLPSPSMMSSFMAARTITPTRFCGLNQPGVARDQDVLYDLSQRQRPSQETVEQSLDEVAVEAGRTLKISRSLSSSETSLQGSSPTEQVGSAHDFVGYQSAPDKAFKLIDAYVKKEQSPLH